MNRYLAQLKHRLRLLPLLVMVATLAFVVRIGDAALQMRDLSGSAMAAAEEKAAPPAAAAKPAEPSEAQKAAEAATSSETPPPLPDPEKTAAKAPEKPGEVTLPATPAAPAWEDASDADVDYSNLRKELYEDLLQRRQQLEQKEKALDQRAALLETGEKELDRKFQELTGLRNQIQDLLKKQTTEEEARIASLVKIYEGMKPKDAARIFNTLDMDILLSVMGKMSERKSSPIIAEMEDDKARNLTTMLAEQKKLPDLPDEPQPNPAQN